MVAIPPVQPVSARALAAERPSLPSTDQVGALLPTDSSTGFADAVTGALDTVSALENNVEAASRQAATGDLSSVSDYMVAVSEAQLATEVTVAIRDRAIAAFNDIMTMQI
jgi:flagellar hook-basal body complex protein FliE